MCYALLLLLYCIVTKNIKPMRTFLIVLVSSFLSFIPNKISAFDLHCPQDYWLDCGTEIWDLSMYGNAYYYINYVHYDAGAPVVQHHLSSCNTGYITRTWTVEDQYWNLHSCTQTLYIEGGDFRYSDITWPLSDLHLTGCNVNVHPNNLPYEYSEPTWNYVSCSQIASSFRDQEFYFGPDCKKILRRWTVIDWCTYTGGSKGIYTYSQTIKISRDEAPIVSCAKEISVQASKCDSVYVNIPGVSLEGESCNGNYSVVHNYPHAVSATNASGMYPVGTTIVRYSVLYACGSEVACQTKVKVNAPGPVPYCLADLNVVLMPQDTDGNGTIDNGMVEVWAKDLNIGSYHPCNSYQLKFSFSADINDKVRMFNCDNVGYNTVQMWVTDTRGHQSYCLVNINVQNNGANIPDCKPDIGAKDVVFGLANDESEEPLSEVIITAKDRFPLYEYVTDVVETVEYITLDSFYNQAGSLIHIYDTVTSSDTVVVDSFGRINVLNLYTDELGRFYSNEIPIGRNYEFTAYRGDDMSLINGSDLSLLANHIFSDAPFNNSYTYLAADINEDKIVNIEDYKILKDLINGEEDEWPQERQWVFYSKKGMDDMTSQPLDDNLSEMVEVPYLSGQGNRIDFMGILKGDLTRYEAVSQAQERVLDYRSTDINNEVTLFPNPFKNKLNIQGPEGVEIQVEIYSLTGKKILQRVLTSNTEVEIDDNELPNGTYMYRAVINGEEIKTGKLLKI